MSTGNDSASDWQLVRRLFDAALSKTRPERAAFVDTLELAEPLKAELRSLLAHHDDATDGDAVLGAPPASAWLTGLSRKGERFGAWQIVGALGAGGMGEVFEARRADGSFEGRAAIKVLKRGMDSAAVLQRFMQERQALARLEHPHIAHMLDAGLSGDGLPYFVMEYVDGLPIDQAARALPLEQRLALFLQLADAVAYAHRNLLVHRDLKPGNVLVTREGQVKLLDFGIAKALDAPAGDGVATEATMAGAPRPFTPNYASPEQVRGEPVGTATDIYSLGALLYLMLTGVRPTGRDASTADAAARAVLSEQPTRPSTLPPAVAQDPAWLSTRKRLQGDLDNIVLKALEKQAERRYGSVEAFAADVRRFIGGHPVLAHRPGRLYVAGKFVRRHRAAVAAGGAAVLALAMGLAATAWQANEARLARDEAQARLSDIRAITRELVTKFGDAVTYLPGGMKLKEDLLKQTLASLDRLASSPDRDPGLLSEVAATYARLAELQGQDQQLNLGKPDAAKINADKAIELAGQLLPAHRGDWQLAHWAARAHDIRAQLLRGQGRIGEGLQELDAGAAVLQRADLSRASPYGRVSIPAEAAALLITGGQLTELLVRKKEATTEQALGYFDRAIAVLAELERQPQLLDELDRTDGRPEDPKAYAQILTNLSTAHGGKAQTYLSQERWDEALAEFITSNRYADAAVAHDPQATIWRDGQAVQANNLAVTLVHLGRYPEALAAALKSRQTAQLLLKQDGPAGRWVATLPQLSLQYGRALAGVGRHAEAVPVFDEGLVYWSGVRKAPPNPKALENAARNLAVLKAQQARSLRALGQAGPALQAAEEAVGLVDAAAAAGDAPRDMLLAAADALFLLSELKPAAREALRTTARARYAAADAIRPLKGTPGAVFNALASGPQ